MSSAQLASSFDPVDYFFDVKVDDPQATKTAYFDRELPTTGRDHLFNKLVTQYGPNANTIAAFNHWITYIMPKQVSSKIAVDHTGIYRFDNVRLRKPMYEGKPLFPNKARRCGLTYSGELIADVHKTRHPISHKLSAEEAKAISEIERDIVSKDRVLGLVPVMLGSVSCHLNGYTNEEKNAVFEDADDTFGYFIIKGSERLIMNQETLASSQQLSTEPEKDVIDTRVTSQGIMGSTVVSISTGTRWPTLKVAIYQSGLKGTSTQRFPIFVVFDVLFQLIDPETFGYESLDDILSSTKGSHPAAAAAATSSKRKTDEDESEDNEGGSSDEDEEEELREVQSRRGDTTQTTAQKRVMIVNECTRMISMFVPPEYADRVKSFLTASLSKYLAIPAPIENMIQKKIQGSSLEAISQAAFSTSARRAAIAAIAAGWRGGDDAVGSSDKQSEAYLSALAASEAANLLAVGVNTAPTKERMRKILEELFSDLFTGVSLKDKPLHLARLIAQHVLTSIGFRPLDDRDSWENKRIKLPADSISQLFNGIFRMSVNRGGILSVDPALTDIFVSSFGPGNWNGRENVVHMVKRDTQMALASQIGRINTQVARQSKQLSLRLLQPSQLGVVCVAETPGGAACGLTKNGSNTLWVSLRRDHTKYIDEILTPCFKKVYSMQAASYDSKSRPHVVSVDNIIYGWCDGPSFVKVLRKATKTNLDFFDVCVFFNPKDRALDVFTTGSRPSRPLFVVDEEIGGLVIERGLPKGSFEWTIPSLIEKGAIEFVHSAEQRFYRVCELPENLPSVLKEREETRRDALARGGVKTLSKIEFLDLYCEIDPQSMFGIAAALMPKPETCQGPRVTYQAGMVTQSLGLYHDSYFNRFDTTIKRIETSRPTFEARMARNVGINRAPTGRMFMVAFVALANNGEDGLIFQAESLERIRMTKYMTHRAFAKSGTIDFNPANAPVGTVVEKFERPDEASESAAGTQRYGLYKAIMADGMPRLGAEILKGDCIIGRKRIMVMPDGTISTTNASIFAGVGDEGTVDRVDVSVGPSGTLIARVRVRQTRPVIAGDKMEARYSQKGTISTTRSSISATTAGRPSDDERAKSLLEGGVAGISSLKDAVVAENSKVAAIEETEAEIAGVRFAKDLPRVASGPHKGLTPDILVNTHAMPSRMTIGMLYEMLASKVSLYTGERVDATAFRAVTHVDIQRLRDTLSDEGCNPDGYETMEHGDGTPFMDGVKVFIAPCYYQFLRHTVSDKIQYRSEGNVMQLTQQPVHGRAKEGGLRLGEMEKSAMCSWGASELVRERLMRASDSFSLEICASCGTPARTNHLLGTISCRVCPPEKASFGIVETPFIHVLISRMVNSLGIQPRLVNLTKSHKIPDV